MAGQGGRVTAFRSLIGLGHVSIFSARHVWEALVILWNLEYCASVSRPPWFRLIDQVERALCCASSANSCEFLPNSAMVSWSECVEAYCSLYKTLPVWGINVQALPTSLWSISLSFHLCRMISLPCLPTKLEMSFFFPSIVQTRILCLLRMKLVRNSLKVLMPSSHFRLPRLPAPMSKMKGFTSLPRDHRLSRLSWGLAREVDYSQLLQSAPGGKGVHGTNTFTRNTLLHPCVFDALHRETGQHVVKGRCFSGLTVRLYKNYANTTAEIYNSVLVIETAHRVLYSIKPSTSSYNVMSSSTRKIQKQNDFSVDLTFISE